MYDGECGLCRRMADVARSRSAAAGIEVFPLQDDRRLRATGIPEERARRAVYLVAPDGRRWSGSEAVARTALLLPGPGWSTLGRLLLLPGVRELADVGYRWVARNRGPLARLTGLHRPPRRPHES